MQYLQESWKLKKLTYSMILFLATACANISTATNQPNTEKQTVQQEIAEVSIKKFKFIPQILTIKKGQTVRWTNQEKRQYHSVWFEKHGEEESEYLFPDDAYEKAFKKEGEFEYRCGPHPEMKGKIIVQ